MASMFSRESQDRRDNADFVIIGIAVSALLILAAFGNYYLEALKEHLLRLGADNSGLVIGLLLLNVALTIYGVRRYSDVRREVIERTAARSEEHTSELQSLMRISSAVLCLKKKKNQRSTNTPLAHD